MTIDGTTPAEPLTVTLDRQRWYHSIRTTPAGFRWQRSGGTR